MPRTDRQLDTERPDQSDERRRARQKGAAHDEVCPHGDDVGCCLECTPIDEKENSE